MSVQPQFSPSALVLSLDVDLCGPAREGSSEAIRRVLDLLELRELPATWALVGLERDEPAATELLATITAYPNQEIATQTCACYQREDAELGPRFEIELGRALAVAERSGVQIRSLVFPRTQCSREALAMLARHGITAYRGRRSGWFHAPSKSPLLETAKRRLRLTDNFSLLIPDAAVPLARVLEEPRGQPLDIAASRFLRAYEPRFRRFESLRVHRMQSEMITAAESGWLYHLWMRPQEFGPHLLENLAALDNLFRNARALANRVGLRIHTMRELAALSPSECRRSNS
jgi:hypothetical protein